MRRFTVLLLLALVPLTLAPRTAFTGDAASFRAEVVKLTQAKRAGAAIPFQVRVTNGTDTDQRAATVVIWAQRAGTATDLAVVATSHGCKTGAAATDEVGSGAYPDDVGPLLPLACTVNVPAGKTRVINGVLRASAPGAVTVSTTS